MMPARPPLAVGRALVFWPALGVFAGLAVLPSRLLQPPLPPVLVAALTLMILTVAWTSVWFREWLGALDVRALGLVHVTRVLAGLWFLVLYRRGALAYALAAPRRIGATLVAH